MIEIEEAFGRLGLTIAAAQIMERRLVYLLVHLTFENEKNSLNLAEVYDQLDEPLGRLISIWKQYGMSVEWASKMEEVRKKRNWVVHKCVEDRKYEIKKDPSAFIIELEGITNLFHQITTDLDCEIEGIVQSVCKTRGLDRTALAALAKKRASEIAKPRQ